MISYMAKLGQFQFSIDTAAFQELQRAASYEWQTKNRIGRKPAQQFTGPGADTITLNGTIYPHYRGGIAQIGQMRAMAGTGKPQALIYGFERTGQYCGRWCITNIEETRTVFFHDGSPRKINFTISLIEYGDDDGDMVSAMADSIANAVSATASPTPGINSAHATVGTLIKNAINGAGAIASSLSANLTKIQALNIGLGGESSRVTSAITRGINASNQLKTGASQSSSLLGSVPSLGAITSSANLLNSESGNVVPIGSKGASDINASYGAAIDGDSDPELVAAMRGAQRGLSSLAKLGADGAVGTSRVVESLE